MLQVHRPSIFPLQLLSSTGDSGGPLIVHKRSRFIQVSGPLSSPLARCPGVTKRKPAVHGWKRGLEKGAGKGGRTGPTSSDSYVLNWSVNAKCLAYVHHRRQGELGSQCTSLGQLGSFLGLLVCQVTHGIPLSTQVGVISWGVVDVCRDQRRQQLVPSYARDFHINLFQVLPWLKDKLKDEDLGFL